MGWNKKIIGIMLSGLGLAHVSLAQTQTFTWEECWQKAAEQNPEIQLAQSQLKQSQEQYVETQSQLFPQINASASAGINQTESEAQQNSYSYGVSGSWLLFNGWGNFNQLDQAAWQIKHDELQLKLSQVSVWKQVRQAFIQCLYNQERIHLTELIAKRRQQNVDLIRLRYAAGREHHGALLLAQAQLAQAKQEIIKTQREWLLARYLLQKAMAVEAGEDFSVGGSWQSLVSVPATPDFKGLAAQHPQMHMAEMNVKQAEAAYQVSMAEFYPELKATGNYGTSGSEWPPDQTSWSAMLNLGWPIFQGGGRYAKGRRSQALLEARQAETRQAQADLRTQLVQAWSASLNAQEGVEVQKQFLQAAEERARIAETQYSSGMMTFDVWNNIEDDYVNTQKAYLDTQSEALLVEADWVDAQGGWTDNEK